MDLVRFNIVEVHSEEPYEAEWFPHIEHVKVNVTVEYTGVKDRFNHVYSKSTWEEIKARGYYLD